VASRGKHSIDVARGDDGIIEHNGGATDTVEDLALNFEGTKAVARQRIGPLFAHIIKPAQPVWARVSGSTALMTTFRGYWRMLFIISRSEE
jgi:hypothetical protein